MRTLMPLLFLTFLMTIPMGCRKDEVTFIFEGDNLPVSTSFLFKFDESEGEATVEEQTGDSYSIDGKSVNRMSGVEGNALFFDGLSSEVTGELSTELLDGEDFAIATWASPRSYPVGTAAMAALTSEGSSTGVMIGIDALGKLVVQYFIDGAFAQQVTNEAVDRNAWSHIMVGISPADQSIKIYLNSELIREANVSSGSISWPTPVTPLSIGKNTMGEMMGIFDIDYYSGALDELTVYAGKVDQETVDFLYSQYSPPSTVDYQINPDYSDDTNRPLYHTAPDFGWANESYGLIYLNDAYHMFYQKNEVFLGIAQQNWGRFTSTDLVSWEEQAAVLWPTEGWDQVGTWAGSSIILQDGTPTVAYTGVDGIKAGVGIATSTDNFATLDKSSSNPVIPEAPDDVDLDFRDPYVWFEGGTYHMLVGSGVSSVGGNVVYYSSPDFEDWTYGGIAYQGQASEGEGQFWEVPILYRFPNGKDMLLVQKTPDATKARTFYWVGQFMNGQFVPDSEVAKDLEVVNGFLSPTVTTDQEDNITAIGIIPDEVDGEFQQQQCWANLFSVPQTWELDATNTILIRPHPNLLSYRGDATSFSNISLTSGGENYLGDASGRYFEMEATISTGDATQIGFIFGKTPDGEEQYRVYYDMNAQEWVVDASQSSLSTLVRKDIRTGAYAVTPGSDINVRIYIDGSVLEVFVNDSAHFTGRFFPTRADAAGIDLFAEGGSATANVTIYEINN